jgi:hypothetical protein
MSLLAADDAVLPNAILHAANGIVHSLQCNMSTWIVTSSCVE